MEAAIALSIGLLILGVFWVYQFVQLMRLSETDFPGKYDKGLWTAAFVLAFPAAPFAFLGWRHAYRAMLTEETEAGVK
jgi:hypothetical protein